MNKINRDIFRAIHEGKWISIEYIRIKVMKQPITGLL